MTPAADISVRPRRRYIDWARGVAVLIMIGAHTLDAWTSDLARHGFVFQQLFMLGGFAAPMFLWLAGLSLALSAQDTLERAGSRLAAMNAAVRRAAEIFILAFLFRLQAFIVSPGSWPVTIFRVDILNVMGLAMAASALIWGLAGTTRRAVLLSGMAALTLAMVTPIVRSAVWVDALPLWVQWHLRPFGDHTTFTLFPWAGFVFAGTAVGSLFALWKQSRVERLGMVAIGGVGALLIWLGFYTASRPSLYTESLFWTSSPTFFAIRTGVLFVALALLFLAAEYGRWSVPGVGALQTLGRNSLFIYWIHIELVYGYATWPIRQSLPLWGTAIAGLLFTIAMYKAIGLRDRLLGQWRLRGAQRAAAGALTV